jgi:hypothetical protein
VRRTEFWHVHAPTAMELVAEFVGVSAHVEVWQPLVLPRIHAAGEAPSASSWLR